MFRARRTALSLTAVLVVLMSVGPAEASPQPEIANIAHRGNSVAAPENSLAAISTAIADHTDFVGIDIRLTSDGVPVVVHDPSLARTSDVEERFPDRSPWNVDQFTWPEIETLDYGSWFGPTFAGTRVPSLDAMLTELDPSPVGIFLEIKDPSSYGGVTGIGQRVVDVLRGHPRWAASLDGADEDLVVQSFDWDFLRQFHLVHPTATLGLLGNPTQAQMAQYPEAHQVNVSRTVVDQQFVDDAHRTGLFVATYTALRVSQMTALAELGSDGIVANDPGKLRDVLAAQGRVWQAARWPNDDISGASWQVSTPPSAEVGSRITLTATLRAPDQSSVRWQWAKVQRLANGVWRTVAERATDVSGSFTVNLAARRQYRVVDAADPEVEATSRTRLTKKPTQMHLFGTRRLTDGDTGTLRVRWATTDGDPITGKVELWKHRKNRPWVRVRTVQTVNGRTSILVRPFRDTRYQARGLAGSWWAGASDYHAVNTSGS